LKEHTLRFAPPGPFTANPEERTMRVPSTWTLAAAAAVVTATAVTVPRLAAGEATTAAVDAQVEVSLEARQVSLFRDGERVATYRIGVGSAEWPTRTGEWEITHIDFNPDWTPPDESWASDRSYKEPGHPDNPMGRVRIVYDPPRSIHGTDDEDSIGRAESHGSIRIANDDGRALARHLMATTGDTRSDDWWTEVRENAGEMVTVELSAPVPIRVREE
jgi:lipoprotein-anchoring transpeptidase ErfK/SrfK